MVHLMINLGAYMVKNDISFHPACRYFVKQMEV